jgi:intraflagellar transport protein 172
LPHKLSEVKGSYESAQASQGTGGTKDHFLAHGRACEKAAQWSAAVDAYLTARAGLLAADELEEVWLAAVRVARKELRGAKYLEVVAEVVKRLKEVKRHEAAAELLREAQQVEAAVACAVEGECWEKAREVAQGARELEASVEASYQTFLSGQGNTEGLLELGHTSAALDVLAKAKDWDRLWEMAAKERVAAGAVAKYAAMRVQQLLDEGSNRKLDEAVKTLQKHGAPPGPAHVDLYQRLTKALLGRSKPAEAEAGQAAHEASVAGLREVLLAARAPEPLLLAAHYTHMANVCRGCGGREMGELRAKVLVSLLRYNDVVAADKLFYVAGQACKAMGHTSLAFVLLNRYVDLTEAIEEGSAALLENSDFAAATAVPFPDALPPQQYLPDEDAREEVRDWVLSVCMDSSVDQTLPTDGNASLPVYGGLYASARPLCVVSGAPVVSKGDELHVNGTVASKRDWNLLVSKTKACPWTNKPESPQW